MGMPIQLSRQNNVAVPCGIIRYYAALARELPTEELREAVSFAGHTMVRREPAGVAAVIASWSYPLILAFCQLAPALATGCTIVLKPAAETSLSGYLLAEAFEAADFPPGVFNLVTGTSEVAELLAAHPGVDIVAVAGPTPAGRRIAAICGEALKPASLELGGKSAAIILDDADLAATVEGLKMASLMNNGQACVAQTRILASKSRYNEVVDAVTAMVGGLAVGDPAEATTEIGPLVAKRQQERVEKYIALGQEEGARVVVGGNGRPAGIDRGWYVQPTVFSNATNDMRISREEIFGPVLTVIPYDDVRDAVRIANDSEYGLAGSVWTADIEQGMDIARRVRTGTYAVNQYTMDFMAPFGGYKASGIGREFGKEGLEHYVELKAIIPPGGGIVAAG
jgi:betaine-aldehyde dehydrogenase